MKWIWLKITLIREWIIKYLCKNAEFKETEKH